MERLQYFWLEREYSQNHIGESRRANEAQYDLISFTYLLYHQELWLTRLSLHGTTLRHKYSSAG